jgi:hypothetical protein
MNGSLRQQSLPSMPFLIAGMLFAVGRLFPSRPLPPVIVISGRGHYVQLSWLGVGVLVCLIYALMYYLSAKIMNLNVSPRLSLLHLLITLSSVFGFGQLHYIGVGTEQSPTTYNPALVFLSVNAFALLLISALLFVAIIVLSWTLKKPAASP